MDGSNVADGSMETKATEGDTPMSVEGVKPGSGDAVPVNEGGADAKPDVAGDENGSSRPPNVPTEALVLSGHGSGDGAMPVEDAVEQAKEFESRSSGPDGEKANLDEGVKNDQAEDDGPPSPAAPFSPLFPRYSPMSTLNLYDVSQYTFGTKPERPSDQKRKNRDQEKHLEGLYKERGMRRSVSAILLLQTHRFPHILLLQSVHGEKKFTLPGGRLRPGEGNVDGIRRKLQSKLSPPADVTEPPNFEIGEQIATWWSPDFSSRRFPYIPAHVTKPKESHSVFIVQLPESCTFAVPKNFQLLAVPLFEIYDNMELYGPVITAVPALLSRFHVNYIGA